MTGVLFETEQINKIIKKFALDLEHQMVSNPKRKKRRVIVISGPTCSGKSALALQLAQEIDGEIISADSMQIYKGMDIGTAKPTKEERLIVPHHLIDICEVTDRFNVVDFYFEARQACQQILERGNVPIVVGGSGFYLHSLIYGPPSGPASVPEVRKNIEEECDKFGLDVMYDRLLSLDPQYAKTITKNDKQKIVRALEIMTLSKKKVSDLEWRHRRRPQNFDFRCWFLSRPKEVIYQRIKERCQKMVLDGFLNEVKELEKKGIRHNSSAAQAIGYRQALSFLSSDQSEKEYELFLEEFERATRHYVKRQISWFKREPLYRWLEIDLDTNETALDVIKKDFEIL